jgi:tetratricopeptide (TPR) repeat protein
VTGEPLDRETVTCAEIDERDLLPRYAAGALPEAERDRVEAHILDCNRCTTALDALLVARESLMTRRVAPRAVGAALLAAAALLVVMVLPRGGSRLGPPAPAASAGALARLVTVDPPPYTPFPVRSADASVARFDEAMTAYSAGDFARAASGLRAVVAADPDHVQAQFYLGASLLLTGNARDAAGALRQVVDAGPSPFHTSAQILLAKTLIRAGDLDAASRVLADATRGGGPRAADAAALLEQLDAVRASRRR